MEDFKTVSGVLATVVTAQASLLVGSCNVGMMLILAWWQAPAPPWPNSPPHCHIQNLMQFLRWVRELGDYNCRSLLQCLSIHFWWRHQMRHWTVLNIRWRWGGQTWLIFLLKQTSQLPVLQSEFSNLTLLFWGYNVLIALLLFDADKSHPCLNLRRK